MQPIVRTRNKNQLCQRAMGIKEATPNLKIGNEHPPHSSLDVITTLDEAQLFHRRALAQARSIQRQREEHREAKERERLAKREAKEREQLAKREAKEREQRGEGV